MEAQAEAVSSLGGQNTKRDEWRTQQNSYPEEAKAGSRDIAKEGSMCSPVPAVTSSSVSISSEARSSRASKEAQLQSASSEKVVHLSSLGAFHIPPEVFDEAGRNGYLRQELFAAEGEEGSSASDSASAEFFDAEECGMSIFSGRSRFTRNLAASMVHRIDRKGARCPIHGCSLVASGDQVYAPYLQRPEPLTDDIILERRMMLSERCSTDEKEQTLLLHKRLEIAYRLQKPRLLSDMKAFKAANPGAVFQDFVSWYGNPGNPLDDYKCSTATGESQLSTHAGLAKAESAASKFGKAAEAIHILSETRNFWGTTWDEAVASPASEQMPLFEVYSTVEMVLDYLENMHPAILINQVMAVNIANAYFMISVSAKDAINVQAVHNWLEKLRRLTEEALQLLSEEASNATNAFYRNRYDDNDVAPSDFTSIKVIAACEAVCNALSETEAVTALATSLLQKFPGQYDVVQIILENASAGREIELKDGLAQTRILEAIRVQQEKNAAGNLVDSQPKPVLREYLFRNLDDCHPCQLSVRHADPSLSEDDGRHESNKGGLMIALTKSRDD